MFISPFDTKFVKNVSIIFFCMPTRDNGYMSDKSTRDPSQNPYSGTQYASQWESNPYANNNREDSVWDRIGNLMGFRTGADKWQDELDVRSQEYDAQLASIVREEEYNSESAKVARMKAAGLNPDLHGLQNASSASEMSEPETSPESNPEIGSPADLIGFGANFTSSLGTIANTLLSLEHSRLVNEGLATQNALDLIDLVNGSGTLFDMPDIDSSPSEGEEGIEGTALEGARAESGRINLIANSLYGSDPSTRGAKRAKLRFIRSMRSRQGTLSALQTHLTGEVGSRELRGDLNVVSAQLAGRKSVSNSTAIEGALLRSTLNDALHKANMAEIDRKWSEDSAHQDLVSEGMTNEAIQAAEIDPHRAAKAANAGFVADIANAGAEVAESDSRKKEAALAAEQARYEKEQYLILEELYRTWQNGSAAQRRKAQRQIRQHFGYGPVNEVSTGLNGGANVSARRSGSKVVRSLIK